MPILRKWIERKLLELRGEDDEVVANFVISEMETSDEKGPDPKRLQINLEGFLENQARHFVVELWKVLIEAQSSPEGIPQFMVDLSTTEADEKARQLEEEMKKYKAMIVELAKKDPQPERPKFDTPRNPKYREDSEKPRRHSRERKSRDRKAKDRHRASPEKKRRKRDSHRRDSSHDGSASSSDSDRERSRKRSRKDKPAKDKPSKDKPAREEAKKKDDKKRAKKREPSSESESSSSSLSSN